MGVSEGKDLEHTWNACFQVFEPFPLSGLLLPIPPREVGRFSKENLQPEHDIQRKLVAVFRCLKGCQGQRNRLLGAPEQNHQQVASVGRWLPSPGHTGEQRAVFPETSYCCHVKVLLDFM